MKIRPEYLEQSALWPTELDELIDQLVHRPGWTFRLESRTDRGQGSHGATLTITVETVNSYDHSQEIRVAHLFPVPPAAYNRQSWRRWLIERCLDVDRHETCEFFTVAGDKPFAPNHGPGMDPYRIVEYETDEARRTSFRGELNP